jgi:hypothetical protein
MKKIILTTHLKTGLYFRGIDAWKVKEVIKTPSWKEMQKDGSVAARKEFEGRTLEVFYVVYTDKIVVKTAYYVD